MRVLGYGFHKGGKAAKARQALTRRFGLDPDDARVAELADNGDVLGVRAREENLGAVVDLLAQHGGEPLVDVDERWTGLRPKRISDP